MGVASPLSPPPPSSVHHGSVCVCVPRWQALGIYVLFRRQYHVESEGLRRSSVIFAFFACTCQPWPSM